MADKPIRITRAVQTSMACPAQWDLWDSENNYYYARYRHGWGTLTQYKDEHWVGAPWKPDGEIDKTIPGWGITANTSFIRTVAEFDTGDSLDGSISLPDFAVKTGIELDPQVYHLNYGEHVRDELIKEGMLFLLDPEGNDE